VKNASAIAAWLVMPLVLLRLTWLMLTVGGRVRLLPRALTPFDWAIIAAGLGLLGVSLYRWRLRPRPIPGDLGVALTRFWMRWRTLGVAEDVIGFDGLVWTVRVRGGDGEASDPTFAVAPVPACPKCTFPVVEARQARYWLRSCTSGACGHRLISRVRLAETGKLICRAAATTRALAGAA
jgi:hypothetical protein